VIFRFEAPFPLSTSSQFGALVQISSWPVDTMSVGTNDGSLEPFVKSNAKVATKVRIVLKNEWSL